MHRASQNRVLKYLGLELSNVYTVTREIFEDTYYSLIESAKSSYHSQNTGYSYYSSEHFQEFVRAMRQVKTTKSTKLDVLLAMCSFYLPDPVTGTSILTQKACTIFLNCKSSENLGAYILGEEEQESQLFYRHYYIFDEATDLQTSLNASGISSYYLLCRGIVLLPLASLCANVPAQDYKIIEANVDEDYVKQVVEDITSTGKFACYISTFTDLLREFGHCYHTLNLESFSHLKNILFRVDNNSESVLLMWFKNPIYLELSGDVVSIQETFPKEVSATATVEDIEAAEEGLREEEYYDDGGNY